MTAPRPFRCKTCRRIGAPARWKCEDCGRAVCDHAAHERYKRIDGRCKCRRCAWKWNSREAVNARLARMGLSPLPAPEAREARAPWPVEPVPRVVRGPTPAPVEALPLFAWGSR